MKKTIPKIEELIGEPTDLDCRNVVKHFLGLTQEEAQKMIAEEAPYPCSVYTEDLMFMAPKGVSYYLISFIEAYKIRLNRGGEEYADELGGGILCSLSFHAYYHPEVITDNWGVISDFISFLRSNNIGLLESKLRCEYISEIIEAGCAKRSSEFTNKGSGRN